MTSTTALVTGGAGFIGSHLAERLLALGHRVRILDDLSTSTLDNVAHLRSHPAFDCVVGSVMDRELLAELVAGADVVFHLAAAVGVQLIVDSPVRTIETNVRGTEMLLELACARRTPVLITSTSEVYGKSSRLPFSEDDDLVLGPPTRGRWAYACSKALDEFLGLAYFEERGLPVCVARLFNTVGPRQSDRYGMVLPRLVGQALAGAPLTVYGDGTQSRCFCDVDDVVWALTRLAAQDGAWGQVFNVGSRDEITILELARRVRDWLDSPSEVAFVPYAEAYGRGFEDIARRVPDLSKIHQLIGFEPRTPLARTVERIADHYRLAA
jgi:UDP-glucose 4-epimerase